ncbi:MULTISPECIES: LTA synthase family protein [Pseudomonas]|jgi:phosphoglycerol transferase MdoB-like AlkP superfamily enzyme|uniref:Phosphoglycerol transferase MdoB n=2 Tax=Pseudomonas mandelii TaxID=75612 RepID=A0AB36D3G7_9PSED|nr:MULTISPECIES: alkaline phosphatase family protein [Pseudomonas]MBU0522443.1 sulfatase-like hydrolase/transferase [Gammaproteobacteria bacterium]MBA4361607.1 sulfatase [Pseudomonas sp.]MBU0819215.1 sulfatase-like hydrolase/transferase [Gammaproteobacteria bacterium]MBU0842576.1 sulfatase-like hydrolase/transferase [Gammaproteobacteria bacterium]MBU1840928.1 sulfatase-like hydrolase/transferase [Gammaproteobacteria bacterium]
MGWLHSRRLHYWLGATAIAFVLFALLRMAFFFGFSGFEPKALIDTKGVWETLSIGFSFDLRLAILTMLPLALLAWMPRWNLLRSRLLRRIARVYLVAALSVLLLIYIIDFGHYAYLGVRINATVLRFIEDAQISRDMVWQTYPVIWISLGWLVTIALVTLALVRLERVTLDRPRKAIRKLSATWGGALMVVLVLLGILGRVENMNLENPVPLRWSDAFFSGNNQIAALGLNPVLFLYDTGKVGQSRYDEAQVREHYAVMANYLGVDKPDPQTLDFVRHQAPQPYKIPGSRPPNVMFIMLESLGTSAVGAYGNPINPTPNLDRLATQSWFFEHFYVPVTGTAKTVWASISGVPDVTRQETATRNPLITQQNTLINAFTGYEKIYTIGGNSGWANMNALIRQSIDGVRLFEERDWKSPVVDVWGISDLDLFKETDQILQALPKDKPFFAYVQTAGNHRPFTIPKSNDGFEVKHPTLAEVQAAGSRSVEQYNAVRLLDFNLGRLMEIAKAGGWYENTIFVMFGDHNTRIAQIPFLAPAYEQLGLESNAVPMIIHAPGLIGTRQVKEAVGLVDLLPTVAGMAGLEFRNSGMGRDIQQPAREGERVVPLVLREGTFPLIAGVTQHYMVQMEHDGSSPTLHDLASMTPRDNVAEKNPEEFKRLSALTRAMHETSRLMLYQNVRK